MTTTQTQFLSELKALLRKWQAELEAECSWGGEDLSICASFVGSSDVIDMGRVVSYDKIPEFVFDASDIILIHREHWELPTQQKGLPKITSDLPMVEAKGCDLTTDIFWDILTNMQAEQAVESIFKISIHKSPDRNMIIKGYPVSISEAPDNTDLVIQLTEI